MPYAVLADIHGNLPALQAAVDAARRAGAERFLILGDLVGYGAQPDACVELVASLDGVCIAGNHDLIALDRLPDDGCIPLARASLAWTRRVMAPSTRRYLEGLPLTAEVPGGVVLAHGKLDDPTAYTATTNAALEQLERLAELDAAARVLLLGHTHRPLAVGGSRGRLAARGVVRLGDDERAVLNPGAVGQSRELLARARLLVLEPRQGRAEFLRIDYDARSARDALTAAGLSARGVHLRPRARRLVRVAATEAQLLARRLSRRPV